TLQDTTIVIHPDSSSATLEARALPSVVSEEVIRFYNAAGTTRLVGRTRLPRGNEWRGNVAVRNGPVLVAGRVQGTLVVINGDLLFDQGGGAEVTGDVIVVGGTVNDTAKARIGGEVRQYREPLPYRLLKEGEEVGLRAFDVVSPVEDWGLHNAEVGWSAFIFGRDYRDYYLNKGWAARVFAKPERQVALSVELRREWQTGVGTQDPWTVFRNSEPWRPNPPIDEGHFTTLALGAALDTRNDPEEPSSGWLVRTTFEHSGSKDVVPHSGVPATVRDSMPTDGSYGFGRMFFDLRHYARISP